MPRTLSKYASPVIPLGLPRGVPLFARDSLHLAPTGAARSSGFARRGERARTLWRSTRPCRKGAILAREMQLGAIAHVCRLCTCQ